MKHLFCILVVLTGLRMLASATGLPVRGTVNAEAIPLNLGGATLVVPSAESNPDSANMVGRSEIPAFLYVASGDSVNLRTLEDRDYVYEWKKDGEVVSKSAVYGLKATASAMVTLKSYYKGSSQYYYDTCRIVVLRMNPVAGKGGEEDGFVVRSLPIRIRVDKPEIVVCQYDTAILQVAVFNGSDLYRYEWRKQGESKVLSREALFKWRCESEADEGFYICTVQPYSLMDDREVLRDSVLLTVLPKPKITFEQLPDKPVCYGNELELKATVSGVENPTYLWSGLNIVGAKNQAQVKIQPQQTGRYLLKVSSTNGCSAQQEVEIAVKRPRLFISDVAYALSDMPTLLVPLKNATGVLSWKVNSKVVSAQDTLKYTFDTSAIVVVSVTEAGCSIEDTCQVFYRQPKLVAGGDGDGWYEPVSQPTIRLQNNWLTVCRGNDLMLSANVKGYGVYQREWWSLDSGKIVSTSDTLKIARVDKHIAGRYYCRLTDLNAESEDRKYIYSDTAVVVVAAGPVIALTGNDVVCAGASVVIDAAKTEDGRESGAVWQYTWSGAGIVSGLNTPQVTVKPFKDTYYKLSVSDQQGCQDDTTVLIRVRKPSLEIPFNQVVMEGETLNIISRKSIGAGKTDWWVDGVEKQKGRDTLTLKIDASCQIVALVADEYGCQANDTCQVLARKQNVFDGGEGDGWIGSASLTSLQLKEKEIVACLGAPVSFEAKISGSGLYRTIWKNNTGDTLGNATEYKIAKLKLSDAGRYVCVVTDLSLPEGAVRVYSDTLMLQVREAPVIEFTAPDQNPEKLCYGRLLEIDASATENGKDNPEAVYRYLWSGKGIVKGGNTALVTVSPDKDEVYTLTVTDENNCQDTKEFGVLIYKPEVDIPSTLFALEGVAMEPLSPHKPTGAILDWYVNGIKKAENQDQYLPTITDDCRISVVLTHEGCQAKDSSEVFFRKKDIYSGGNDDGWFESSAISTVRLKTTELAVCRGQEAKLEVVVAGVGIYRLQWKFLDGGNVSLPGENGYVYTIANFTKAHEGRYYCVLTNLTQPEGPGRYTYSDTVLVKMKPAPIAKISAPVEGAIICRGTEFTLDASSTELDKDPDDVYYYQWTGTGQILNANTKTATAIAEGSNFKLTVTNAAGCESKTEINIRPTETYVSIPSVTQMTAPGVLTVIPRKPKGGIAEWSIGGEESGKADTAKLNIAGTTKVSVIYTDNAGCKAYDTCQVFVRELASFKGEDGDGFFESIHSMRVKVKDPAPVFCRGERGVLDVTVQGGGLFLYEWRKKEDADFRYEGKQLIIDSCAAANNGSYYCIVTDLRQTESGRKMAYSDTAVVSVFAAPLAKISLPEANTEFCYGSMELILDASATENTNEDQTEYKYRWIGENIIEGGNEKIAKAEVGSNPNYIVEVTAGNCKSYDSVAIKIVRSYVRVPNTLLCMEGEPVKITPRYAKGGVLSWYLDGVLAESQGASESAEFNLNKDAEVVVAMQYAGCTVTDTTRVYVKKKALFAGGDEDGWNESRSELSARVNKSYQDVCRGTDIQIEAVVRGYNFYRYEWWKVGGLLPLGTDKILTIRRGQLTDNGKYYCIITDVSQTVSSKRYFQTDTAEVNVIPGPLATIGKPEDGDEVCNGSLVTLDASETENYKSSAADVYTYRWTGPGLQSGMNSMKAVAQPSGNAVYVVEVTDGNCMSRDTVRLKIKQPLIVIPSTKYLAAPDLTVTFAPKKRGEGQINWYLDGKKELINKDSAEFTLSKNAVVVAELVDAGCYGYDTSRIFVRNTGYVGGDADGWDEGKVQVWVKQKYPVQTLCRGSEMVLDVDVIGGGVFRYQWRKTGNTEIISTEKILQKTAETGKYYCTVIDITNPDKMKAQHTSDTAVVTTLPGPIAEIASSNAEICLGESVELNASPTENNKVNASDVYTYRWKGEKILSGETAVKAKVEPAVSAMYILTVEGSGCRSYDTAYVKVSAPQIRIPSTLYKTKEEVVVFAPKKPKDGILNWYVRGGLEQAAKDTGRIHMNESDFVVVELVQNQCKAYDTCFVFIKDVRGFMGGNDDGFFVSADNFSIRYFDSTSYVCVGQPAHYEIYVSGSGVYRYSWKKKRAGLSDLEVSTKSVLDIVACKKENEGSYYCDITEVGSEKTLKSPSVSLYVIEPPRVKIEQSTIESVCKGTQAVLKVDQSGLTSSMTYQYVWTGPYINGSYTEQQVRIRPERSAWYALTVSDRGCAAVDSVRVTVLNPQLSIPKAYRVFKGETINVLAETSPDAVVNWLVNGNPYRGRNPLIITDVAEKMKVVASLDGKCVLKDSAMIYVRTKSPYAGGDEDGFAMPNFTPNIIDQSEPVAGCGVDTTSLFVKVLEDPKLQYTYKWQKYVAATGEFVDYSPDGDNVTGHLTPRLRFNPIQLKDEGRYRCLVRNNYGYTTGREVSLIKGNVPVVVGKMNDLRKCTGDSAQFIVTAKVPGGGVSMSYRWYRGDDGHFAQIQGSDMNKMYYTIRGLAKDDEGLYMTEIYNLCGSAYDTAFLEVMSKPVVVEQRLDSVVCVGSSATFTGKFAGGTPYGVKLIQVESIGGGKYKDKRVLGTMNSQNGVAQYTIEYCSEVDNGYYQWRLINSCDTNRGPVMRLIVEAPPTFVYQKIDTLICKGSTYQMSALATAAIQNNVKYSWTKDGKDIGVAVNNYTIGAMTLSDEGKYVCSAYNSCVAKPIKEFNVKQKDRVVITVQPQLAPSYCEGLQVNLSVEIKDATDVTGYRWYQNSKLIGDVEGRIQGTQKAAMTIDSVIASDAGKYMVGVINSCGEMLSKEVQLTVDMPARFIKDLSNQGAGLCIGESKRLTVAVDGHASMKYTWAKNKATIPNVMLPTLDLTNVTVADSGLYCIQVVNKCMPPITSCAYVDIISPVKYKVLGTGAYCSDDNGLEIRLSGFQKDAVYRLYRRSGIAGIADVEVKVIAGKDVVEGENLTFGVQPAGSYYVHAFQTRAGKTCHSVMIGDAVITIHPIPQLDTLQILREYCANEFSADLKLTGSENNEKVEYSLEKWNKENNLWSGYGAIKIGNGTPLEWLDVPIGKYRMMVVNVQTLCRRLLDTVDVQVRELPLKQDFYAVDRDSTVCEGMVPDVVLTLKEKEAGIEYTLLKNGENTGKILQENVQEWGGLDVGKYEVMAENNYGCQRVFGQINVEQKPAPVRFELLGGKIFCQGDLGKDTLILSGSVEKVRYDLFVAGQVEAVGSYYGNGNVLQYVVDKRAGEYYVIATDTVFDCVTEMLNRREIQGSQLALNARKLNCEYNGSIQLNVGVAGSIGTLTYAWAPVNMLQNAEESTLSKPWTKVLTRATKYQVIVSDTVCTESTYVEVAVGSELMADILLNDCFTAVDTLVVCEGSKLNLCSYVSGSTGSGYDYCWLDNTGTELSFDPKLTDYDIATGGWIYLQVISGIQRVKDSVWIEVGKLPVRPITDAGNRLCVADKEQVTFKVVNAETNVKYTLEYSMEGSMYQNAGMEVLSESSDPLTFTFAFEPNKVGYYRILAQKKYLNKTWCGIYSETFEVQRGAMKFNAFGGGNYCEQRLLDSISIDSSQTNVYYRLLRKVSDTKHSQLAVKKGSGDTLNFVGSFGNGDYVIVADYNVCVDTMNRMVKIRYNSHPQIGRLIGAGTHCESDEGIAIGITEAEPEVKYTLYRDSADKKMIVEAEFSGRNGEVHFGQFSRAGKYYVQALNMSELCDTIFEGITILRAPQPVTVEGTASYCQADKSVQVTAKLYKAESGVAYTLCHSDQQQIALFGEKNIDSLYFKGLLRGGKYIVKATLGSCQRIMKDSVKVVEYPDPLIIPFPNAGEYCESDEPLKIGLTNAQADVTYTLYRDTVGKAKIEQVVITGKEGRVEFGGFSRVGEYYIEAENQITGCRSEWKNIQILRSPKYLTVKGEGSYCQSVGGMDVQVKIFETESDVTYHLRNLQGDSIGRFNKQNKDSLYYDGYLKEGRYVTIGVYGNCRRTMKDTVDIKMLLTPRIGLLTGMGDHCEVDGPVEIAISEAQENILYSLYRDSVGKTDILVSGDQQAVGQLNFGAFDKVGKYYIHAKNSVTGCDTIYRGVNILRSPKAVKAEGSDSYCEADGGLNAHLILSGAEADVRYHLTRLPVDSIGLFDAFYKDSLYFNGKLKEGRYIVTADFEGCRLVMTDTIEVSVIKSPVIDTFINRGSYCELDQIFPLQIGISPGEAGVEYVLYRDSVGKERIAESGVLTGEGEIIFGSYSKLGRYYVEATQLASGCHTLFGDIRITKAPEEVAVTGGGAFCAGDSVIVTLSGVDPFMNYWLEDEKGKKYPFTNLVGTDYVYKDTLSTGLYWVKAASGTCELTMSTKVEVFIKQHPQIDALLGSGIWCQDQCPNIGIGRREANVNYTLYRDSLGMIFEMAKLTGTENRMFGIFCQVGEYYVQAIDTKYGCEAEFKGITVLASPRNIKVVGGNAYCEGVGSVMTNVKVFKVEPDVVYTLQRSTGEDVAVLNGLTDDTLYYSGSLTKDIYQVKAVAVNACATVLTEKISVIEHLLPTVGEIKGGGEFCESDGKQVFGITIGRKDVLYTLLRDSADQTVEEAKIAKTGAFDFGRFEKAGRYYIYAVDTLSKCEKTFEVAHIKVAPKEVNVLGSGEYCEGEKGVEVNVKVYPYELGIGYALYSPQGSFIADITNVSDDTLSYATSLTKGIYKVRATNGICNRELMTPVAVTENKLPEIGYVIGAGQQCESNEPIQLGISAGQKNTRYVLRRDSAEFTYIELDTTGVGEILFGSYNKAGRYYIYAKDTITGCEKTFDAAILLRAPRNLSVTGYGEYCEGMGGVVVTMKTWPIEKDLSYRLLTSTGQFIAELTDLIDDTLTYTTKLSAGRYVVVSQWGNCELTMKEAVVVKENPLPLNKVLMQPLEGCAGKELTMGIVNSQQQVEYEIFRKETSNDVATAIAEGNGEDLIIGTTSVSARYRVHARNSLSGCSRDITGEYIVKEYPEYYKITVSDTAYCAGDRGVSIGITGTQRGVNYMLQLWNEELGIFEDMPSKIIIGVGASAGVVRPQSFNGWFKAGVYRIRTDYCDEVMHDTLVIKEMPLPEDILFAVEGNGCEGNEVKMVLKDAREGECYVLFKDGIKATVDTLNGKGRDTSWLISNAVLGVYHVQALKGRCAMPLTARIEVGAPVAFGELAGEFNLCANVRGEFVIELGETNAIYHLSDVKEAILATGIVEGGQILFKNVEHAEEYYVTGERGSCKTRKGPYRLTTVGLPPIAESQFVTDDCAWNEQVTIQLKDLKAEYLYTLENRSQLTVETISGYSGDSTYMEQRLGEYCLTVKDMGTGCISDPICRNVREALPLDSIASGLAYCEGEIGTRLHLSGVSYQVIYRIYALDGTLIDQMLYPDKNFGTMYQAGKYVFYKERTGVTGGCIEQDTFEIVKGKYPPKNIYLSTGKTELCAGDTNIITVLNTEKAVEYTLSKVGVGNIDTLIGNGSDVSFDPVGVDGSYRIAAKSFGLCSMEYDTTIVVHPLPGAIIAEGCSYCYDTENGMTSDGCQIRAQGMKTQVLYQLWNGSELDRITNANSGYFRALPAGKYEIMGETAVGCRDTVARVEIKAHARPRVFTVGTPEGVKCGQNLAISTIDGSQSDSIEYLLYLNDYTLVAGPVKTESGNNVVFERQKAEGEYKIYARVIGDESCGEWMKGSVYLSNALIKGELLTDGGYCAGATGRGFTLSVKESISGWRYFVTTGAVSTDTLSGKNIRWDKINNGLIQEGRYFLCAMNICDEVLYLDTVVVWPNALPRKISLAGNDTVLCAANEMMYGAGNKEISLIDSEIGVKYSLYSESSVKPEEGLKFLGTQTGDGNRLNFGGYNYSGIFYVKAENPETGCGAMMDTISISVAYYIQDPGFRSVSKNSNDDGIGDICKQPGQDTSIYLCIVMDRYPKSNYYLKWNGIWVDSLTTRNPSGMRRFKPQSEIGCYHLEIVNPLYRHCRLQTETYYCLGLAPSQQMLRTDKSSQYYVGDTLKLCAGDSTNLYLKSSEIGVKYDLTRDGASVLARLIEGSGEELNMGIIKDPGVYRVNAFNGCNAEMEDHLIVKILNRPELKVQKDYVYCEGSKGVVLKVHPLTQKGFEYGVVDVSVTAEDIVNYTYEAIEWDNTHENGEGYDFTNNSNYYSAGEYKIYVANNHDKWEQLCPTLETVNVSTSSYPRKDTLTTPHNIYLCGGDSRDLILKGSEKEAEYTLLKKEDPTFNIVKRGTGSQLVFTVSDTGTYYVEARYDKIGNTCAGRMIGEVVLKQPRKIMEYPLDGLVTDYCYRTMAAGSVKLNGSQLQVAYELYKDGIPTGIKKMGTEGVLTWTGLEGLLCEQITNDRPGINYMVMALDTITGCLAPMPRMVTIRQENEPEYVPIQNRIEACYGDQVFVNIVGKGCNLNYQFLKEGKELQNSESASYEVEAVNDSHAGWYECVISNSCGSVSSGLIELKLYKGVMLDDMMKDKIVCSNGPEDVALTSTAYADTYEWFRQGAPYDILSKSMTLNIPGAMPLEHSGDYICYAKNNNKCPGVYDTVSLSFNRAPVQNFVFRTDTVCLGSSHQIVANSTDTVKWKFNGKPMNLVGTTLKFDGLKRADEGLYSVRISNTCEAIDVPVCQLYIDSLYQVNNISPVTQRVCAGNELNLSVEIAPQIRMTYKWEKDGKQVSVKTNTYKTSTSLIEPELNFKLTYGNKCKTVSQDMKVFVDRTIEYSPLPEKIAICSGQSVKDSMLVIVHPANMKAAYQWFKKEGNISTAVIGATKDTMRFAAKRSMNGFYYCQIENGCGSSATNITELAIDTLPKIVRSTLKNEVVCEGTGIKYTVDATGNHLKYRWVLKFRNGTERVEEYNMTEYESSSSLVLSNITYDYDSCRIKCYVSNNCDVISTDTVLLRVNKKAYVSVVSDSISICRGTMSEVQVTLVNGKLPWSFSYKQQNGVVVPVSCSERVGSMFIDNEGEYLIDKITEQNNCIQTPVNVKVKVTYRKGTTVDISGNETICLGNAGKANLTVAGGTGPWSVEILRKSDGKLSEEMNIPNPLILDTAGVYTLNFVSLKDEIYVIGKVIDMGYGINCETTGFGEARMHVVQPPVVKFNVAPDDHIGACETIDLDKYLQPNMFNGTYKINGSIADKNFHRSPGSFHIVYEIVLAEGCSGNASYTLQVDSLPAATVSTGIENLCVGDRTTVAIALRGATPFVAQCSLTTWSWKGKKNESVVRLPIKDNYVINVNDIDSLRTYSFFEVTDRHGCRIPSTEGLEATVRVRKKPVFSVRAKHPRLTGNIWRNDILKFGVLPGEEVEFNTKVGMGVAPYNLEVALKNQITDKMYYETTMADNEASFVAKDTGVYRFNISDQYCTTYGVVPITRTLFPVNKFYFRMKAILEGAYQADGCMISKVLALPKYKGITDFPQVGERQIIDWVNVEIRKERDSALVARDTFLLLNDGVIVDVLGNDMLSIIPQEIDAEGTSYYFVLKHRHHLAVMTKNKWNLSKNTGSVEMIDFTDSRNVYVGDGDISKHMTSLGKINGRWMWGLCAGDINLNQLFTISNPVQVMKATEVEKGTPGYYMLDVNFNGLVEWPMHVNPGELIQGVNEDAWIIYKNRGKFSEVPRLKEDFKVEN